MHGSKVREEDDRHRRGTENAWRSEMYYQPVFLRKSDTFLLRRVFTCYPLVIIFEATFLIMSLLCSYRRNVSDI